MILLLFLIYLIMKNLIDFDFEPIEIDKLEYKLTDFYNKYYKINDWS